MLRILTLINILPKACISCGPNKKQRETWLAPLIGSLKFYVEGQLGVNLEWKVSLVLRNNKGGTFVYVFLIGGHERF